ncbi:hypothetical protein [Paracoccus marcusii]|jgi:hypothetical protein|uniref:hypothetical protein n=1 Tax=Paracoccus marcusii TaxID=59779 RepID=UPI0024906D3D|nr:hypothetical protein [Paracoccus marcusii]
MSAAAKSPAELIADLTDQVRLLRQDVGNLTATATTKAEAAKLMASVQKITADALEQNRQIGSTAADMSRRMHRDSMTAAQEAAAHAVRGLEDKISAAANHMRLESVRSSRQALHRFGGGLAVYGGLIALGAVLGVLVLLVIQGRGDAQAFGKHPGVYCRSAGGEHGTMNSSGERYCVFWPDR